MDKPKTKRLWQCVKYYLALCLAKGQCSDTIRGKRGCLKKFFLWCRTQNIGRINQIDLDVMDNYMAYLNSYRKALDNQPLCLAQKRNLLTAVKVFIAKMSNKGLLEENTLARIELPSIGRPLPKVLFNVQEIEQMLAQTLLFGIKGVRDRAILETFFATGIRRCELLYLTLDDVDFSKQLLRVNHGAYSHACRSPILIEADHLFSLMPITYSH